MHSHILPAILMYHSVDDGSNDPHHITVTPRRFAEQMRWLRDSGLRGVGVSELLHAYRQGNVQGLVGLTFDDGYEDFVRNALPTLLQCGFSGTVYAVAGMLGGSNAWDETAPCKRLLTARQVLDVYDSGMEVGSHGATHRRLTRLDASAVEEELQGSRKVLEDVIDHRVESFCYPYGDVDPAVLQAAPRAGYENACAVGGVRATTWSLPRVFVGELDGPARLRAKLLRAAVRGAFQGSL